jgi:hypothetical protein
MFVARAAQEILQRVLTKYAEKYIRKSAITVCVLLVSLFLATVVSIQ